MESGRPVRGGIHLPIRQAVSYPQRIMYRDNYTWFSGLGDPEGFLYLGSKNSNGTRSGGAQQDIIDALIDNGSNVLYIQACRKPGDGTEGETPWYNNDPDDGVNMAILNQWHGWFRQLRDAGIIVLFFLWDDISSPQNNPYISNSDTCSAAEILYYTLLVNQFQIYDNVIWMFGEETEKEYTVARVNDATAYMQSAGPDIHIGTHQINGYTFGWSASSTVKHFGVQLNNYTLSEVYGHLASIWPSAVANGYCYSMLEIGDPPAPRGAAARKLDWVALMAGCCGAARLEMDQTMTTEMSDCQRQKDFCAQTLWYEMVPDNTKLSAGGDYMLTGNDHYIVWTENLTGDIEITSMVAGTYDLLWQSCDVDYQETDSAVVVTAGTNTFSKPAGVSAECALYIERVS